MGDLHRSMKNLEILKKQVLLVHDASQRFDKRALLQIHDDLARQRREIAAKCNFEIRSSFLDPSGSGGAACSVPPEKLNPISFNELKIGEVHLGRVVYGTLCADAYRISGIMTLLEDDNGLAVRLAIYNAATSQEDIKRLFPRGDKVAVKEPYFKIASDGGLLIRVDNPANVLKFAIEKGKRTELHVDVDDLRKEGNRCFREQKWDAATENYTKCIDAALLQLKKSSGNNNNINTCLLQAYSNRAETRLQMKEFELALKDTDQALGIDSSNLKALYRKGRALIGLRQYAAACKCLVKATEASPAHKEIQDALHQANTLYAQSLNDKYDISDYLLGRASSPPTVADFVGSVEIKMTEDSRGRGLYATQEIGAGQFLLVSNAVAVACESASTAMFHVDNRCKLSSASQEDLVAAVVCAARKSQRLLRQLYSLFNSSTPSSLHVPAIDLFKTDDRILAGSEVQNEILQVDVNRIRDIVRLNSFGESIGTLVSKSKINEAGLGLPERNRTGLWLLPSLINHSCLPNSRWLLVGNAIFIHASKAIGSGEEITIPYFDVLVPLLRRQADCKNWGFKCKCKRCILEHSFRKFLEPIIALKFEQLDDQAKELLAGLDHRESAEMSHRENAEFAMFVPEAEEIIRSSHVLKTEEEKLWIRASFWSAYVVSTMLNSFSWEKLIEAIQSTVPGNRENLGIAARRLKCFRRSMADENKAINARRASDQAREACVSVFGRQSEDVLNALILMHSK